MHRWDRLVDQYIRESEQRGLAPETLYGHRRELERAGCWLKRRRPRVGLEDVDGELLVRYVRDRTRFLSKSSLCSVLTELRGMGEYLVRQGVWMKNPMRWIRGPKLDGRHCAPRPIRKSHLQALWDAAESRSNEFGRYRGLCILSLLYGTGLRRGEIERLDIGSWDRDGAVLSIDGRKTGRQRRVPVGEGVWRCVEAYLPRRHNLLERTGHLDEPALFLNKWGERLSGDGVSGFVHRLAQSAGVPLVSLHQFRHSCASDLLESGVPLPQVQRVLGHAAIQTTMRYTQIADPQRQQAAACHPINDFLGTANAGRNAR